jgi:hypothetical protein
MKTQKIGEFPESSSAEINSKISIEGSYEHFGSNTWENNRQIKSRQLFS